MLYLLCIKTVWQNLNGAKAEREHFSDPQYVSALWEFTLLSVSHRTILGQSK